MGLTLPQAREHRQLSQGHIRLKSSDVLRLVCWNDFILFLDCLNSDNEGIARAERDGTRAENRFRLSPKRTSPFKSLGASVQSTAGSRGVRISLSNAG